ncbi:membrane integrity-associated transporter subunit PqiC [Paraburkholderia bengalensis]|uniref:Membrane integrity-associated transporter subunit PqiC n=2 Tax=Paraburkholderia bengalensis TaxID=2747562 RepID=A0ABU8J1U1_9BURK
MVFTFGLVMFLGACASTPRPSFYRLASQPFPQRIDYVGAPLVIVIDDVTIPEVVDRPQLVYRASESQVRVDDFARWAEPLKSQIADVVAADLRELFRDALVFTAPQKSDRPTVRVTINVRTFDSVPGEHAVLVINWSILTPGAKQFFKAKSGIVQGVDGAGYDALVDAHSRALADFSVDVALAIVSELRKNSSLVANP